jgi:YegS/Rv2252/BmrU family lipid kinase
MHTATVARAAHGRRFPLLASIPIMGPSRAVLIVNNESRTGAAALPAAVEALRSRSIEVIQPDCRRRQDVSALIRKHCAGADCAIIAGGDGTINAAADGLAETGLPLGILPTGTANDLARTLGIPADVDRAIDIIAAGHRHRIDLGRVNGHPFFNVASLGLSADLAILLTRDVKRRFGRLGYMLTAIRVLLRARPFRAVISAGDRAARVWTLQIAVGNGRFYGGGNVVERSAAIDDRRLDIYSLEFRRAWKLALLARSFRSGEHGAWEQVRTLKARELEVVTRRSRPVNADGEIVTRTPARFTIEPGAVTVLAPEAAS